MDVVVKAALMDLGHLSVVAVLALALVRRSRGHLDRRALALVAVVSVTYTCITYLPGLEAFDSLEYNWQGKLAGIVLGLVVIAALPSLSFRAVGFTSPRRGSWRAAAGVLAALLAVNALLALAGAAEELTLERLLFQASMPGLDEELFYRGILLVLLDRVITYRRHLWGVDIGFGAVGTTVLFALGHGLTIDGAGALQVDPFSFVFVGAIGAALCWLRLRSGSLWPSLVTHNALNSGSAVLAGLRTG
ncbi:MAG: CPBP family intramembrane glutamic endopeptidase [Phycicoccus sp.]